MRRVLTVEEKAFVLLTLGFTPRRNESLEDFVNRCERELRKEERREKRLVHS